MYRVGDLTSAQTSLCNGRAMERDVSYHQRVDRCGYVLPTAMIVTVILLVLYGRKGLVKCWSPKSISRDQRMIGVCSVYSTHKYYSSLF
jgi:hypothetical protein